MKYILAFLIIFLFGSNSDIFGQKFEVALHPANIWRSPSFNTDSGPFARTFEGNVDLGLSVGYFLQKDLKVSLSRYNHFWITNLPENAENSGGDTNYQSLYYDAGISKKFNIWRFAIAPEMGIAYRSLHTRFYIWNGRTPDYLTNRSRSIGLNLGSTLSIELPYNLSIQAKYSYRRYNNRIKHIHGLHVGVALHL